MIEVGGRGLGVKVGVCGGINRMRWRGGMEGEKGVLVWMFGKDGVRMGVGRRGDKGGLIWRGVEKEKGRVIMRMNIWFDE
ncbi:hypothetical protein [Neisseria sicca]|uniref:hypothetical protein n=1 Tax=Neisseria sicca TaxID=490 RepID=UPI0011BD17A9|nr:hypothetical protein [Neisseria sicca]